MLSKERAFIPFKLCYLPVISDLKVEYVSHVIINSLTASEITGFRPLSEKQRVKLSIKNESLGLVGAIVTFQFSSVAQFCLTLCDPMDCSMPGLPVHNRLLDSTQTLVHRVSDAIQPSHHLSSPSPAFNLSQYQGLFQWVSSSHQVAKVLEFQLQHQSFQWIFRTDFH